MSGLERVLGDDLVGVYLHGSLVLGCFNPQQSDVDVLVVTRRRIDDDAQRRLAPILRRSSGPKERPRRPPFPLELTFLTEEQVAVWRYPTRFDLHFHESFRAFEQARRGEEDWDLAAHFTIARSAGVALRGPPPGEVFPAVPHEDFADSLLRDLDWCLEHDRKLYAVLSASRIWATLTQGGVHSKRTGAVWALERAPDPFRKLIERALAVYSGELDDASVDAGEAARYVDFVQAQLAPRA